MPSVQLQTYLQARADGATVEDAAEQSGIGLGEALLHEADIESGELELPGSRAGAGARACEEQPGETIMEDVQTSIRIGDGPRVPIDLKKGFDDPANAEAMEQMTKVVAGALGVDPDIKPATDTGQRLKLYIERVERLDDEIRGLNEDKSDLFREMKSAGFDTKTIKRILKLRKMEPHVRQEAQALLSTYMDAVGMTPIEQAIALAA